MRTATRQYKFRLVFLWLTQCTHALWHSFLPVLPVWPSTLTLGITMEDRSHDKQRQTNHGSIINNFKKNRPFLVLNNPAVSSELTYKTVCFLHLIKYYPDWHFSTMYFFCQWNFTVLLFDELSLFFILIILTCSTEHVRISCTKHSCALHMLQTCLSFRKWWHRVQDNINKPWRETLFNRHGFFLFFSTIIYYKFEYFFDNFSNLNLQVTIGFWYGILTQFSVFFTNNTIKC